MVASRVNIQASASRCLHLAVRQEMLVMDKGVMSFVKKAAVATVIFAVALAGAGLAPPAGATPGPWSSLRAQTARTVCSS